MCNQYPVGQVNFRVTIMLTFDRASVFECTMRFLFGKFAECITCRSGVSYQLSAIELRDVHLLAMKSHLSG